MKRCSQTKTVFRQRLSCRPGALRRTKGSFRPEVERDYPNAILPVGTARDTGFRAGSQVSRFEAKLPGNLQPLSVTVELVFQSVAPSEIERLLPKASSALVPELKRLRENARPVVMASREFEISEVRQIRRAGLPRLQFATR